MFWVEKSGGGKQQHKKVFLLNPPRVARSAATVGNPFVATSSEFSPSTECRLLVGDVCKASVLIEVELTTL